MDRRKFLKIAGASALIVGAKPLSQALAQTPGESFAPEKPPLSARRWAMVIDLKKCGEQGQCRVCVDACHQTHNVPDFGNPKDEVKWIWKEDYEGAFPTQENEHLPREIREKPALVFCNHCENPPCVRVCPTQATWKRESDGIVMMDMHRCIGCRYCIVACPYGSRSFNWRNPRPFIKRVNPDYPTRTRGVVEKCNFCEERLAKGERPACEQACPAKAMLFGDLENPEDPIRKLLAERFSIRRKPELGTQPSIYYLV
ncbi:MAG: 4Fe-4S dicluster domain-containing protein [Myxococcales bacterium]|nr:MAG: 4Fe-4S dicluster domain-containing protein [Myxococcales bacterium]